MNRSNKAKKGMAKGMPSAVVLSILIHVALFLLAGMLVVFTVVKKEDRKFEPPKAVERPQMKLKKPKVKVKKTSKPKPTTRIVTKMDRASMPEIQLPEMSGMGDGLAGGVVGFDLALDLGEVSIFGAGQTIGNDFVGTFYDLKRNRSGKPTPMDPEMYLEAIRKFVKDDWKATRLSRYYQSPKKLYTTTFAIPPVLSIMAPEAFGEKDTDGWLWAAHYKGELVYPEDIRFRFWGMGDDVMLVRVNGEVVLISCWPGGWTEGYLTQVWQSSSPDSHKYPLGINRSVVGDWIDLKAGVPLPMEVLIGELPGGVFQAMLCVEVESETYPKNPFRNGPKLPIFKTEEPSQDLMDAIHGDLDPGDASVTNGPVFRDYAFTPQVASTADAAPPVSAVEESPFRTWNSKGGKSIEAEYLTVLAGNAVLKNAKGKQIKIPVDQLSEGDQLFLTLANPPRFDIEFLKKSRQVTPPKQSPFMSGDRRPYRAFDSTFGVKVKQMSTGGYDQRLTVEYFAIGEEVDGDNYKLLGRGVDSFIPGAENQKSLEFSGDKVRATQFAISNSAPMRGIKYGGFLITVTDERGKIVQYKTPYKWLFKNLEDLKNIPVGKYFDKECNLVGPPRPGSGNRAGWSWL